MVQTIALVSPEEIAVFAWHPGVGTWRCGGDEACKRARPAGEGTRGAHAVAGKLPSVDLFLPAKSSEKKLLSFQILAKEEFFNLEDGRENTELM